MEIRSFLAFRLPEEIRRILTRILKEMKKSPLDLRWVNAENIHLTVIFLGNISTSLLEPMKTAVTDGCSDFGPFNISLNGAGAFYNKRHPRVLWVGLDGDMERMSLFKHVLQKKLGPFGIKEEKRRFNPHLTLGRFRKGAKSDAHLDTLLPKYKDLTSPVCSLNELALFESILKPGGAVYTQLDAWPLNGQQ